MQPGLLCVVLAVVVAALAWILSLLTREYSWTDRAWSLAPIGYAWVFAGAARLRDARLDVVAVLITLWGARLTYNFARKGGYARGGEDYRWGVLRRRMQPWQFAIFNAAFVALYQNLVILLITLPMWSMFDHRGRFGVPEVALTILTLAAIVGETVADEQQWRFHQRKLLAVEHGDIEHGDIEHGDRPETDFLDTGLFRYSRHPNYFFELTVWWLVFLFAVSAARTPLLPTIAGPVLLTLLFAGSVRFTESISVARHPGYARYQRETSAVIPWFGRALWRPSSR